MEIIGLGTDIVKVDRMKKFLERPTLGRMAFDEKEISYACRHKDPLPFLAARFAVKESIIKILGSVTIKDACDIVVYQGGMVELRGRPREVMDSLGIVEFKVSISHEREYALAFVIGVGR